MAWGRTDGVITGSRQQVVGKVWSLVIVAPDDTGHRWEEGRGHPAEDVPWVLVVGGDEAVMSSPLMLTADFIKPFVELQKQASV